MATEVGICNLALSHIGDDATVSSIDPPEGSVQAAHCATFYPIARDSLLEMHSWGFATKRVQLAMLGNGWPEWTYAYSQPNDALNIIAILPPDATDDYSETINSAPMSAGGYYVPQAFSCEVNEDGAAVILTDQANAVLRYTSTITDVSKFSPLFTVTLSWYLASMVVGPILKGEAGAAESKRCMAIMQQFLAKAMQSDSSQRRVNPQHNVGWMSGR